MRWAYYNEIDGFACGWLRALIKAGLLPEGEVDERSVLEVGPDELRSFRQCHFFAGIGGWAHALSLAGWPEDREIWTASLPCQPLSVAGQRRGDADERHLWPAFHRLVAVCRPAIIVGEQVASRDGREWLAGVRADLEALGYACGAAVMPACAVGAPHRRERLYWGASRMGNTDGEKRTALRGVPQGQDIVCGRSGAGALADAEGERERADQFGSDRGDRFIMARSGARGDGGDNGQGGFVANAAGECVGWEPEPAGIESPYGPVAGGRGLKRDIGDAKSAQGSVDAQGWQGAQRPSGFSDGAGFWDDAEWRAGADGKARRVEPGVRLLAHGVPNRVGLLRGFGNAIVPQVGARFVQALMEV